MMDPDTLLHLRKTGRLVTLEDGSEGVPVTLQWSGDVPGASRAEKLGSVLRELVRVAEEIGVAVAPETASAASQTVEGIFPVDRFEELVREARDRNVRVDILADRGLTD